MLHFSNVLKTLALIGEWDGGCEHPVTTSSMARQGRTAA
jgi:hypothetical protein